METDLLQRGQIFRFAESQESIYMTSPIDGSGLGYLVPAGDAVKMHRSELLHDVARIVENDEMWVKSAYWSLKDLYCIHAYRLRDGIMVKFVQAYKPEKIFDPKNPPTCPAVVVVNPEPREKITILGCEYTVS